MKNKKTSFLSQEEDAAKVMGYCETFTDSSPKQT